MRFLLRNRMFGIITRSIGIAFFISFVTVWSMTPSWGQKPTVINQYTLVQQAYTSSSHTSLPNTTHVGREQLIINGYHEIEPMLLNGHNDVMPAMLHGLNFIAEPFLMNGHNQISPTILNVFHALVVPFLLNGHDQLFPVILNVFHSVAEPFLINGHNYVGPFLMNGYYMILAIFVLHEYLLPLLTLPLAIVIILMLPVLSCLLYRRSTRRVFVKRDK